MIKGIIYLSGQMCAGKTTLADNLIARDPRWQRHSIIGWLREGVRDLADATDADLVQNKHLFRDVFQAMVDVREKLGTLDQRIIYRSLGQAEEQGKEHLIFDDGRFPYEIVGLERYGVPYVTVRLVAPWTMDSGEWEAVRVQRHIARYGYPPTPAQLHHQSETALGYYHHHLLLDGTQPMQFLADDAQQGINEYFRKLRVPAAVQVGYRGAA